MLFRFLLLVCAVLFPSLALAQADPTSMPVDLDWSQSLALVVQSLGGLKGASAVGIAAVVTQVIMAIARSPLGNYTGRAKLFIFLGLSLISGVISLRLSGVDWIGALVHSTTLSGAAVLVNQIIQQTQKAKEQKAAADAEGGE